MTYFWIDGGVYEFRRRVIIDRFSSKVSVAMQSCEIIWKFVPNKLSEADDKSLAVSFQLFLPNLLQSFVFNAKIAAEDSNSDYLQVEPCEVSASSTFINYAISHKLKRTHGQWVTSRKTFTNVYLL